MGGGGIVLCIELLIEILVKLGSFNISGQGVILKKVLVCFSNKKQEGVVVFKKLLVIGLFFIPFLSHGQFLSVCGRTPEVKNAIMEKIAEIDSSIECSDDDLTALVLSEIKTLEFIGGDITSLKAGDFSGLSSLEVLMLTGSKVSSLPEDIFSGLSSLKRLYLHNNQITSLPSGVFSDLSLVEDLYLSDNQITSLPSGVFSGLSSLERIAVYGNPLDENSKAILKVMENRVVIFKSPYP